jgi:hypothetical protein
MIRSILIASLLMGGGFFISSYNVGYSQAGEKYISSRRDQLKSLRPGFYYGRPGYGSFHGGK